MTCLNCKNPRDLLKEPLIQTISQYEPIKLNF